MLKHNHVSSWVVSMLKYRLNRGILTKIHRSIEKCKDTEYGCDVYTYVITFNDLPSVLKLLNKHSDVIRYKTMLICDDNISHKRFEVRITSIENDPSYLE